MELTHASTQFTCYLLIVTDEIELNEVSIIFFPKLNQKAPKNGLKLSKESVVFCFEVANDTRNKLA